MLNFTLSRRFIQIASLLLGTSLITIAAAAAEESITVVTADKMLDVTKGTLIDHPQITIRNGRITAVERVGAAIPAGAIKIDLAGMTLMPGFIDMHVHLTGDPHYGGYRGLEFTDNFWTVVGVANAKKTLEAGFTTVRNVGSSNYDDVALKQGIEEHQIPGPRIVPATYAIGATGTQALGYRYWTDLRKFEGRSAVAVLPKPTDESMKQLRSHFERVGAPRHVQVPMYTGLNREVYLVTCIGYHATERPPILR